MRTWLQKLFDWRRKILPTHPETASTAATCSPRTLLKSSNEVANPGRPSGTVPVAQFPEVDFQGSAMDLRAIIVCGCEVQFDAYTLTEIVQACLPQWGLTDIKVGLLGTCHEVKLNKYETHIVPVEVTSAAFGQLQTASGMSMAEFAPQLLECVLRQRDMAFAQQIFSAEKSFRSRSTSLSVGNRKVLCVALGAR